MLDQRRPPAPRGCAVEEQAAPSTATGVDGRDRHARAPGQLGQQAGCRPRGGGRSGSRVPVATARARRAARAARSSTNASGEQPQQLRGRSGRRRDARPRARAAARPCGAAASVGPAPSSGCSSSRGCGSNVTTPSGAPSARAWPAAARMHLAVAAMDPVEVADRHRSLGRRTRHAGASTDDTHGALSSMRPRACKADFPGRRGRGPTAGRSPEDRRAPCVMPRLDRGIQGGRPRGGGALLPWSPDQVGGDRRSARSAHAHAEPVAKGREGRVPAQAGRRGTIITASPSSTFLPPTLHTVSNVHPPPLAVDRLEQSPRPAPCRRPGPGPGTSGSG